MMEPLADRIYEAALVPELWPRVLDDFAEAAGSAGAALLVMPSGGPPRWASSEIVAPHLDRFAASGAWRTNRRASLWRAATHAGFLRDVDLLTPEQAEGHDVRYRTHGLGWQVGTVIALPSGDSVVVSGERRRGDGAHDPAILPRLDALRPHLARASAIAARLGLERVRTAVATLDVLGVPAAVLSSAGRVVASNDRLEGPGVPVIPLAGGGLAFSDPVATGLLQTALRTIAGGGDAPVRSIPVRTRGEAGTFVAHLVPIRGLAHDLFGEAATLLVVTPVRVPGPPDAALLHALFDLTPAESRLLSALAGGARLTSYAEHAGVRLSTVRTQLAAIFDKTGTSRQADLVGIVASVAALPGSALDGGAFQRGAVSSRPCGRPASPT